MRPLSHTHGALGPAAHLARYRQGPSAGAAGAGPPQSVRRAGRGSAVRRADTGLLRDDRRFTVDAGLFTHRGAGSTRARGVSGLLFMGGCAERGERGSLAAVEPGSGGPRRAALAQDDEAGVPGVGGLRGHRDEAAAVAGDLLELEATVSMSWPVAGLNFVAARSCRRPRRLSMRCDSASRAATSTLGASTWMDCSAPFQAASGVLDFSRHRPPSLKLRT